MSFDETGVRSSLAWMKPRRVPSAEYTREVAPSSIGLLVSSGGAEFATLMTHPTTLPAPISPATQSSPSVSRMARCGPDRLRRLRRCRSRRDMEGRDQTRGSPENGDHLYGSFPPGLPAPRTCDAGLAKRPQRLGAQGRLARQAVGRRDRRPGDEDRDARLRDVGDAPVARVFGVRDH